MLGEDQTLESYFASYHHQMSPERVSNTNANIHKQWRSYLRRVGMKNARYLADTP
jgi:hypothetical protein